MTMRETGDERTHYFRDPADADAYRHAGVDRTRSDGNDLFVHDDERSARVSRTEAVHRHRKFRDHGDPVLHLGGQLLDPWGGCEENDQLCLFAGWPLVWRPGAGRRAGLRIVRGSIGLQPGHGGGNWVNPDAGDGQGGFSEALRRWRHHHVRCTWHPDPAVNCHGDVCGCNQYLDWRAVHGWRGARHCTGPATGCRDVVPGLEKQLPALAAQELEPALARL